MCLIVNVNYAISYAISYQFSHFNYYILIYPLFALQMELIFFN